MAKTEISRPATAHIPPFGLRLQPELKERIEASAREHGRSMNAEIASILEEHFRDLDHFVRSLSDGTYEDPGEAAQKPLREEIERLEEEAKWLRETLSDSNYIHKRIVQTSKDQSALLANGLVRVLDALPASIRLKLGADGVYQYALGIRDDDINAVVAGLKAMFGSADGVREVFEEAQTIIDAKNRGEDLSGFADANFDRMLSERDTGAAPGTRTIDVVAALTPSLPSPNARKRAPKKAAK